MARLFGWEFSSNNDCSGTSSTHSHTESGVRYFLGIRIGSATVTVHGNGPCPGSIHNDEIDDATDLVEEIYRAFRPSRSKKWLK